MEKKQSIQSILTEDADKIIDQTEIDRIFRIHLNRVPTEQEIQRFDGIKESEFKIIEDYIKIEENKNSLELDKSFNEEKGQTDATKIQGDLANKEMKIKGDQSLDTLKNIAAVPGMAGSMAGMPSVIPPMPQRPPMGGQGGCGPQNSSNTKYIKDGKNFLIRFE